MHRQKTSFSALGLVDADDEGKADAAEAGSAGDAGGGRTSLLNKDGSMRKVKPLEAR